MIRNIKIWTTTALCLACLSLTAQKVKSIDLNEYATKKKLIIQKSLTLLQDGKMKGVSCKGIVWIKDLKFSTGTIDVDLRGKDVFQQSFLGIAFHGIDTITYDAIYFRPFNFKATDPDRKIHAVQYVSSPDNHWETLRKNFNGVYEKGIEPPPEPTDWFHARIEVGDQEIKVYVNDAVVPSLTVNKLNNRTDGLIGLWSTKVGVDGDFANLKITSKQ